MQKQVFKVLSSVMTLLFVMIIPYFVGINLMADELKTKPEITAQATVSSDILGVSDIREPELIPDNNLNPQLIGISLLGFLVFAFIYSKLPKGKLEI